MSSENYWSELASTTPETSTDQWSGRRLHEQRVPHQSPDSIRNEVFGHRMRGLDEDEVREYLDMIADQVELTEFTLAGREAEVGRLQENVDRLEANVERLSSDLEWLRAENRKLREQATQAAEVVSPHAVEILSQAQQVADQLVEEAVIRARNMMMSARVRGHDPLRRRSGA